MREKRRILEGKTIRKEEGKVRLLESNEFYFTKSFPPFSVQTPAAL